MSLSTNSKHHRRHLFVDWAATPQPPGKASPNQKAFWHSRWSATTFEKCIGPQFGCCFGPFSLAGRSYGVALPMRYRNGCQVTNGQ